MLGFDCSPEMVDDKMEEFLVKKTIQMNYNVINKNIDASGFGYRLPKNLEVDVYNEKDSLQKRRQITRPGNYKVVGWSNGLYHVKNQKGEILKLPRYKLNPKLGV